MGTKDSAMYFHIQFPAEVVKIAKILADHGHNAYAVGGCVRDSLMGRSPSDWDMTTDANPDEMLKIFKAEDLSTIPTGLKHGTVTVIMDKKPFEITTFRIDGEYTDSRRPDNVVFSLNIDEDLRRRDFTVNAMAANPLCESTEVVDLFGGLEDIKKQVIRCVGDPTERFSEDALRILRAIRFSSVLGFEIEKSTLYAMTKLSYRLADISAERKTVELEKKLLSDNADYGFEMLSQIGATEYIHKGFHAPCVPLTSLPKSFPVRLAALIEGDRRPSLAEMKLSNKISHLASLLADRAFYDECSRFFDDDIRANARYMISKYREDAEAAAMLRNDNALASAISEERAIGNFATEIKDLAVDGNTLMAAGVPQKSLGVILAKLLLLAIKVPQTNNADTLTEMAKSLLMKGDLQDDCI